MNLADMVPIGDSDTFAMAYLSGQRLARANAYLHTSVVKYKARMKWLALNRSMVLDPGDFYRGFYEGYYDEIDGLATPLPGNDIAYNHSDMSY